MSQLAQALSAAMGEYLSDGGEQYRSLYAAYMGSRPLAMPPSLGGAYPVAGESTELKNVLRKGLIRIGCCARAPYYFLRDGQSAGFELQLASALVSRIRKHYNQQLHLEWVMVEPASSGEMEPDSPKLFKALYRGLAERRYEVAFSGAIYDVGHAASPITPTMRAYRGIIHTGRANRDLAALHGCARSELVGRLAQLGPITLASRAEGPSRLTLEALAAEVRAIGGTVESRLATFRGELEDMLGERTVDFVIGDGIALSHRATFPGFAGRDLEIDLEPGQVSWIQPFTMPDRPGSNSPKGDGLRAGLRRK